MKLLFNVKLYLNEFSFHVLSPCVKHQTVDKNVLRHCMYHSLFGQSVFFLIFMLNKNKSFRSEALLKIPPSPLSMEGFGLHMQK